MPELNDHVRHLVDDYLHDLLEPADAARVERHCAACPACRAALDEARQLRAALQAVPPSEASPQLLAATMRGIDDHERRRKRRFRLFAFGHLGTIAAAALVLLGLQIYFSSMTASPWDLVVLGQDKLMAATTGSLRVRLVDRNGNRPKLMAVTTGSLRVRLVDRNGNRPLAGVPVTVELSGAGQAVELARFSTDAHGSGQPLFQLPDWAAGKYTLRVVAGSETVSHDVHLQRSWKLMLTSDKPVYQPGQTIQVRALALRTSDLHPVAAQPAVFTLIDPKSNVLFKEQAATSKFGIVSTKCLLDREILEGSYTIACKVGDTESRLAVEVKKYVLPKFKIEPRFDRPFYQPGQTVRLTVQADYFFGKPVVGGKVHVEVRSAAINVKPAPLDALTDDKGEAILTYTIPDKLVGREQDSGDAPLSFRITLTDSAGQKQERTADRVVTAHPMRIEVLPEGGTLVEGVPNKVYLLVSRADGTPVPARLTVSGVPGVLKTDKQGLASFEHTPKAFGVAWTIQATDDRDAILASRRVELPCGRAQLDFLLRMDRAVYEAGQTVHLTALGGWMEPVFVDILKDGQTLLTQTIDMTGSRGDLAFDLPPDLFGTVQVCAYRFGGVGLPVRKTRVFYVRPVGQVKIAATLDSKEYRPGGKAKVNLKLTDAQGVPLPGALSLAAVDEAVFSVLSQRPGMEQTFYLLEKELLQPVYKIYPWSPEDRDAELEQAAFAGTVREDGEAKAIHPSGAHSLAAESFPVKVQQVEQKRLQRLDRVHDGWALLVIVSLLIAYVGLWCFARWMTVAIVHGVLFALAFFSLLLLTFPAAKFAAPEDAVAGRAQSTLAAPDVEGIVDGTSNKLDFFPPSQALGGSGSGPQPRVRQLFVETLLWKPELITDDQGRASLDIDLADSITTWRLAASAVTADGRLGGTQLPVKVFQPFFADLNLPVALTRGDEVGVPVVVYNYLDRPQTVTLALADAPWFAAEDALEQKIDLKPGEVREARFRLRVLKVGQHTLQVTARGLGAADALKRSIEVVPDGRRVEQVVSGTLQQPADVRLDVSPAAIEGSVQAFVKIYPSSFSQLVEGLDNIFQMPSGCFEQTSSTTYPNVLALDYLRRTQQSAPAVEAKARQYIHLGYQRLVGFEVPGGGFDWFGHPPANRRLTAYGLMEFEDMARVHDVDPALIDRTRRWLLSSRQRDGSWDPEDHGLHIQDDVTRGTEQARLATTAYIAWSVFPRGAAANERSQTRDYLLAHTPESIRNPHVLALVCNALLALDSDAAIPYLDRLDSLKRTSEDDKLAWWEQPEGARTTFYGAGRSGHVETTALAVLALVQGQRHPGTARGALAWLVSQKDGRGTWHSTQATVLSLKALLAGTGPLGGHQDRHIEVRLNDRPIQALEIPAGQAEVLKQVDLSPHLVNGPQRLTITETTGTAAGYQVTFRYHLPEEAKPAAADPLEVKLAYDRTELAVDDTVKATARVVNRMKQPAPMVMLDLPVPAGFVPVAEDFAALVKDGRIARYQVRPRQVLVYLRALMPDRPLELTYRLRATMPVKVAAPGARVYEYYDPDREGRSPGARLTVKARE
jgi:hypothetical protein